MKIMAGLLKPSSGKVIIDGHDIVSDALEAKRTLGYVPEEIYLLDSLTGRQHLEFTCDLWGVVDGREERIAELMEMFDLVEAQDKLIDSYSHGMKKKIAIACALVHSPKVLILDEPTSGLDPKGAGTLKRILKELSNRGASVLTSTHILEIAENMCTRVGIIHEGRLIAEGSMNDLLKSKSLEELFFELTGGPDVEKIISHIKEV
jgi:ABC-2 type transport system ATP-binding protein